MIDRKIFKAIKQDALSMSVKYKQSIILVAQSFERLSPDERDVIECLRHYGGIVSLGDLVFKYQFDLSDIEKLIEKGLLVME